MSSPYRAVFDRVLPDATQAADLTRLVRLAGQKLGEVHRRVQNETLGHRGRPHDPLYRACKLLAIAPRCLDEKARLTLTVLLRPGDPKGEVTMAWCAKEATRELYALRDPKLALEWIEQHSKDMRYRDCAPEIRQLGRTMNRWRERTAAWHQVQVFNDPTEAMDGLTTRIQRIAFGLRSFLHWRIRVLLCAGRPDWNKLPTIAP